MNIHLVAHNIMFILGGLLNAFLALTVIYYYRNKKFDNLAVTFLIMIANVMIFQFSHVIGVSVTDADLSRKVLMFNLSIIGLQIFMTHWFAALIGNVKKRRIPIGIVYVTGFALIAVHIIWPETYLLQSVPKMYFNFYYNPGPLLYISRIWFILVGIYYTADLAYAYFKSTDLVLKNRLKYVFIAIVFGSVMGQTASLLVFNIQFDPLISSVFSLYAIPITYAMVKYELLDVRVMAKRAFMYTLVIILIGIVVIGMNMLFDLVTASNPELPRWVGYMVTAFIVGVSGIFFWQKTRETDMLKYEFVTIITHKFRTPLTRIRWATEYLFESALDEKQKESADTIKESTFELVELTDTLVTLSSVDESEYMNKAKIFSFTDLVDEMAASFSKMYESKSINFVTDVARNVEIRADREKVKMSLHVLFENAYLYTPENGRITVRVFVEGKRRIFTIEDTGIGIKKADIPFVFTKFFRSKNAMLASTEGMGIGLYLSKKMIERNGGAILLKSEEGKGTQFSVIFYK